MWQSTCYLVRYTGTARPAFVWMAQFVKDNPVSVSETASMLPASFELEQNFPNPFNPTTSIRYSVPQSSHVALTIFDILGREIRTLINEVQSPGHYTVTFDGRDLASGVYFYRLTSGSFSATKKFVMVK